MTAMIIVIMGVAGAGKSTVAQMLAAELGCEFLDADTLHSPLNIQKMTRGIALTDADRAPWLASIHARIVASFQRGECFSGSTGSKCLKRGASQGELGPTLFEYANNQRCGNLLTKDHLEIGTKGSLHG